MCPAVAPCAAQLPKQPGHWTRSNPPTWTRPHWSRRNREERRPGPGGRSSNQSFNCGCGTELKCIERCGGELRLLSASSFLISEATENVSILKSGLPAGQGGRASEGRPERRQGAGHTGRPALLSQGRPHTRSYFSAVLLRLATGTFWTNELNKTIPRVHRTVGCPVLYLFKIHKLYTF